jgi:hypothetical protein
MRFRWRSTASVSFTFDEQIRGYTMRWAIRIAFLAALVIVGWVAVVSLRSLGLNNATTWVTLAAALAVLAAVASAWTSQRMVELQEDALEPNPVPWIDLRSRYGMAQFRITNHGGSAAYDIRLSWERPLHDAGDRIVTLGIDTPIRVLAPRQSASVLIGIPHMWFSKVSDTTSKGSISFLNASGHRRSTPFTVSAEHERTALVHYDELPKTLYELQKLPDLLEKLCKAVAELSIDRENKDAGR